MKHFCPPRRMWLITRRLNRIDWRPKPRETSGGGEERSDELMIKCEASTVCLIRKTQAAAHSLTGTSCVGCFPFFSSCHK